VLIEILTETIGHRLRIISSFDFPKSETVYAQIKEGGAQPPIVRALV
jgi:hypothetical protein